jgi:hypothetical protein
MQKNYSPVRIKNPSQKHSLVRLLSGQKLSVIFDKEEFQDYKLDIAGNYLSVLEVNQINNGWMATIVQETDKIDFDENTLLLGTINLFNSKDICSASLCVVSQNANDDILRIINPMHINCNLEPSQIMDVVFYTNDHNLRWAAYPSGINLCLEQLQYVVRQPKIYSGFFYEHFFRFRYNSQSIQYVSEQPFGKYDGGHILFTNSKSERSMLKLTCAWRGKGSVYKALLVPKIPPICSTSNFKKFKKQVIQSHVKLSIIETDSLEAGCNVLISRI